MNHNHQRVQEQAQGQLNPDYPFHPDQIRPIISVHPGYFQKSILSANVDNHHHDKFHEGRKYKWKASTNNNNNKNEIFEKEMATKWAKVSKLEEENFTNRHNVQYIGKELDREGTVHVKGPLYKVTHLNQSSNQWSIVHQNSEPKTDHHYLVSDHVVEGHDPGERNKSEEKHLTSTKQTTPVMKQPIRLVLNHFTQHQGANTKVVQRKPSIPKQTGVLKDRTTKTTKKKPMRHMGHFHIPHFGMIDGTHYQRRPTVKGSHSVEGTFLWAVGLFGTVENGAIVLTAIFSKKFKKPLHILVGSLAATDLFISLIYIPSYTYFLLEGDRNLADHNYRQDNGSPYTFCQISRSIFVEIASVTLTIKTLISIYLYVLTCSRNRARHFFSTRNTLLFISLAWILNLCIMFMPTFMGYSKVDFYPNAFVCSKSQYITDPAWEDGELGVIYSFTALTIHIGELGIIMCCFVQVHRAILKGRVYCEHHREKDHQAKLHYLRATKITILVFISFIICWLPLYIVNMIDPNHTKLPNDVHHLVMDLLLLKSSVNPSIYIYGIRSLRFEMKLLCMCRCCVDPATAKAVLARPPDSTSVEEETKKY